MLILGVDFETTGLSPEQHLITEVGAVLWDTKLHSPVKLMGYLVKTGLDAFEPKIIRLTGITPEMCESHGVESERGLKQLLAMHQQADACCAHNASFDHGFFRAWLAKHEYSLDYDDKLWIDTRTDLPFEPEWSRKLGHLAYEHGFLNPFPHRALFDVMTMLRILDNYDVDTIVEMANSPSITVKAIVGFADKDKARGRGYHPKYDDNNKFKMWAMKIKECQLEQEREAAREAGFSIEIVSQ